MSQVSGCTTPGSSATASVTLTYAVDSPPTISITSPVNGATYSQNDAIDSNFSCADGSGPGISSWTDQSGRGSGQPIDTSTAGSRTFIVTATSSDGLTSSSKVIYNVAAPPAIWLPLPANGAIFTQDQSANSYFLCADGKGGPGLTSCVDQSGRASGAPIDTSAVGTHTFTVTAKSADGQTTSTTARYRVVPPPTVSQVKSRHGVIAFEINLPAAGAVDAMATASFRSFALAADTAHRARAADSQALQPAVGSFVYGRADIAASQAGMVPLIVIQTQGGRLLLRDHRGATVQLAIDYTGTEGLPQTVATVVLHVTR